MQPTQKTARLISSVGRRKGRMPRRKVHCAHGAEVITLLDPLRPSGSGRRFYDLVSFGEQ